MVADVTAFAAILVAVIAEAAIVPAVIALAEIFSEVIAEAAIVVAVIAPAFITSAVIALAVNLSVVIALAEMFEAAIVSAIIYLPLIELDGPGTTVPKIQPLVVLSDPVCVTKNSAFAGVSLPAQNAYVASPAGVAMPTLVDVILPVPMFQPPIQPAVAFIVPANDPESA